ncbi:MAG: hypothetical protein LWW95_10120 [Candidatus Desulfofervidus auxilii]|nr:hypothetical protein [Candidatus Desulfofervidus auxilii]
MLEENGKNKESTIFGIRLDKFVYASVVLIVLFIIIGCENKIQNEEKNITKKTISSIQNNKIDISKKVEISKIVEKPKKYKTVLYYMENKAERYAMNKICNELNEKDPKQEQECINSAMATQKIKWKNSSSFIDQEFIK